MSIFHFRTKSTRYYFEYFPFVNEFHFRPVTKVRISIYKWVLLIGRGQL